MLAQAAHLVDAVVPAVPLRHNGLSFPFELSLKVVTNPKVLRAPARINYEVTARYFQRRAAESSADGKTHVGAITFVHRFGTSLNMHLHLHVCVFDGVFVERDDGDLHFSLARALSKDDLCKLVETVAVRVVLIIDRIVQHTAVSGSDGRTLPPGSRASLPLWISP